jgi:molybdopterin synthase sulfur carrier subunit
MSLLEALTLVLTAAGVAVALATAIKAYLEYAQQGQQRRAEMFFSLRERLRQDNLATLAELIDLTQSGHRDEAQQAEQKLAEIPLRDKREYLGLFEEVALFMNRGQVERELAHSMFGYYALLCEECLPFWNNVNYDSPYWSIFHDFCSTMRVLRERMQENASAQSGLELLACEATPQQGSPPKPRVAVKIPTQLRSVTRGYDSASVFGNTIGEVLDALYDEFPGLEERIATDGELRRFVNVFVRGEDIKFLEGLETVVRNEDEVTILPAVSGG